MADIVSSMIEYPGKGAALLAFQSRPQESGPHPAVLVVHERWGLNDHIKDVALRLSREGYIALAPDVYSRFGHQVTEDPNEAAVLMSALKKENGLDDLNASVEYLKKLPEAKANHLGIIGFGMGGSFALLLPCRNPEITAAVSFYGAIPESEVVENFVCPLLYFYGYLDPWIQMKDIHRLRAVLNIQHQKKLGEAITYRDAQHGFFDDTRKEVYEPDAAKHAWARTLTFLSRHLNNLSRLQTEKVERTCWTNMCCTKS
jgi:carboxymethylenebutenolidase